MYISSCQCCNSNKIKTISKDTYKCSNCDHIYRNYLNDGVEYHTNQYRTKGNYGVRNNSEIVDNKLTNVFHEKRRTICTKRLEFVSKFLNKEYDLLDIGGGGGTFAKLIKEKVNNVDVTELNPLCINECKRLGIEKVFDIDFLKINFEKKYDLITAWHVLEHIKDINKFIDRIKLIAKKYVIIEVPKIKSMQKVLSITPNKIFDGHYHYFSEKSISILFKDFNILELKEGIQKPSIYIVLEVKNNIVT